MKTRRLKRPGSERSRRDRSAGRAAIQVAAEPAEVAQAAGLRYVNDMMPGIRRRRVGKGFSYVSSDGRTIRDARELARIRALAIPPAYSDVWICPTANGHIQATGRDARSRKQYRYHPRWRAVRDETKFSRMIAFSEVLPRIRERVDRDLGLQGLPREKVVATVVRLLECTGIRVGNDEYARANSSYGLTTLRDEHVEVSGSKLRFEFRGKSGKTHAVDLSDRRLARIVQRCQALPGEELFQYLDEQGVQQTIDSGDVNGYLKEITGQDFTAKDFRTWSGTILAVAALSDLGPMATQREAKAAVLEAIEDVAKRLNNTRAVCRKYYVHPAVVDTFLAGSMLEALADGDRAANAIGAALEPEERAVVHLLMRQR